MLNINSVELSLKFGYVRSSSLPPSAIPCACNDVALPGLRGN